MPYINSKDGRREKLQNGDTALNAGELNYQIFWYFKYRVTNVLEKVIIKGTVNKFLGEKPNYQKYNDMTGCLIRCALEIDRRLDIDVGLLFQIASEYDDEIAKYEDIKIAENGDV